MAHRPATRFHSLIDELKRRRVFRVTAAYVVVSLAVLQAADILTPALGLPPWTMTLLVVVALCGLVLAVALSWIFDLVPNRAAPTTTLPATDDGMPCVAVLPFLDLSAAPDNELFADGVTEDVIAHLSRIHTLRVIARSSVMRFRSREPGMREIARALAATHVLDGSVRRADDRVRIVAQLVDPVTDRQLWAETYDRRLTDIFAIQSDVALSIASALRTKLSPDETTHIRREPTASMEAYQHYQRGRHLYLQFGGDSMHRAIGYFRRALELDPEYALAWASLAIAVIDTIESGVADAPLARREATQAAAAALRIDPELGEAHTAQGYVDFALEFDWQSAEAEFRRAIELRPSDAEAHDLYGRMCSAIGRFDEAIVLLRRAHELDPLVQRNDLATTLLRAGRYEEAEAEAARALEFEPNDARAHATLGWAMMFQQRYAEGIAELEQGAALGADNPQWLAQLGQARAMAGDVDGARDILRRMEALTPAASPYHLAYVHTGLGEHDRAIELLERATRERNGAAYGINASFLFRPLRAHPRFRALVARIAPGALPESTPIRAT